MVQCSLAPGRRASEQLLPQMLARFAVRLFLLTVSVKASTESANRDRTRAGHRPVHQDAARIDLHSRVSFSPLDAIATRHSEGYNVASTHMIKFHLVEVNRTEHDVTINSPE